MIRVQHYNKKAKRMGSKDEQQERREVLENDRKVRGDTFFSRAQADAELEAQGRFKKEVTTQVIGKTAVPLYPHVKEVSPWAKDPVPREPPLGFSVEDHVPVGEAHEVVAPPPADDGLDRQPLVKRRV
jgi:hypothetical protein